MESHGLARSSGSATSRIETWLGQALLIGVSAALAVSCTDSPPVRSWNPMDFGNGLDLGGEPQDARDLSVFAFPDLGAWHMFGLPDPVSDTLPGNLAGPLLLTDEGAWLASSFLRPEVEVDGTVAELSWVGEGMGPAKLFPGRAEQKLTAAGMDLRLDLIFESSEGSRVRATVTNATAEESEVRVNWTGNGFFLPVALAEAGAGIEIVVADTGTVLRVESFDSLDGYWRGPVWLDQVCFGVVGLERYGHTELAHELRERILAAPEGLVGDGPIFENYHPVTAQGLNAPHFSWSAAHLLLLLAREDGAG